MKLNSVFTFFKENSILNLFILAILFFIPLAWSRYLNANYVSAKFFLLFFVSAVSLLVSFKQLILPKLSRSFWALLIATFVLHLTTLLVSQNLTDFIYLFKFFSFCFLIYYFYSLKLDGLAEVFRRATYAVFIVVVLILVFALMDFYKFRIEMLDLQSGLLLGSFGNVNMMNEFLILTVPFLFSWVHFKDFIPKLVKFVLFVLWLFMILYCRSRSAWIGLFLWTCWQLFKGQNKKEILIALAIAIGGYWIAMNSTVNQTAGFDVKSDSFKQRLELYKATASLIKENPLGVGVSHFDSFLVPYQVGTTAPPSEYLHYDQPHSEMLRWTAQFGWAGFLIAIIFIGLMSRWLLLRSWIDQVSLQKKSFLTESFLVLIPQILFQFPYFNPASSVYLAFVFAMFLGLFAVAHERKLSWRWRAPVVIVALLGITHSFLFVTSILFESTESENFDKIEFACDYYPINQNACFIKTFLLLKQQKFPQARQQFKTSFADFKYHRGLLRLVPTYAKYTTGDISSCEDVQVYKTLFPDEKFFDASVMTACAPIKSPLTFQNPEQFKRDYDHWLNKSFSK